MNRTEPSGLGKRPDHPEQALGLLGGQHSSGLVQDQNLSVADQRLEDLHALLGTHREVFHQGIGVNVETELAREPQDVGVAPCDSPGSQNDGPARSRGRCFLPR